MSMDDAVIDLCRSYLKVTEICEGIAASHALGWIYVGLQKPYWRQAWISALVCGPNLSNKIILLFKIVTSFRRGFHCWKLFQFMNRVLSGSCYGFESYCMYD